MRTMLRSICCRTIECTFCVVVYERKRNASCIHSRMAIFQFSTMTGEQAGGKGFRRPQRPNRRRFQKGAQRGGSENKSNADERTEVAVRDEPSANSTLATEIGADNVPHTTADVGGDVSSASEPIATEKPVRNASPPSTEKKAKSKVDTSARNKGTPTSSLPPGTEEKQLVELVALLLSSIEKRDWELYSQICDARMTCIEPESRGEMVAGHAFHKFYFDVKPNTKNVHQQNTTVLNPSVRFCGSANDVAIITYTRLVQRFDQSSGPVTQRYCETRIFEKRHGASKFGWMNVHFHRSE